ncbi:similar to Saccharomyces cerevisiae YMR220W ERG8 Phosphomevalonate kinase [Maudiozyma barnettii]|uniref:Phosphomevalonate kinase n=1 Tax=Maudiozyma barnettii TaxID=61262 RepID=A0A8H2ZI25_9SACH|nr:phosphomevalonate kinase [Kazachstania barnettii]CAB4252684.1 similar to Saccharomyces cerevisiae YMR220W ERG8 Phosphomevalonate kinase [Kazachstania barnettii]CAD1780474.1 similar to Saccharomyces cerevisiae YMR220W ERG8 Phosphomevalonate kinase [Kazachstania barnettii]
MKGVRAFSAPGKALLAGGYLVLDPKYESFVVALSARMHAVVSSTTVPDNDNKLIINVKSSQFNNNEWNYSVSKDQGYDPIERDGKSNPFIEFTISNVCNYFSDNESFDNKITIEIFSDAEYHSKENSLIMSNNYMSFPFHKKNIQDVPKTGLGSSAGLVTVLTTALSSVFLKDLDVSSIKYQHTIHNLAQIAHCQAQGKIGSGFDVAAATYGSIIYRRFLPEIISQLPELSVDNFERYHNALKDVVDTCNWKMIASPTNLPKGFKLIMGDVNTGSETVKLVQKVKKWYANNQPHSLDVYNCIDENNMKIIQLCKTLDSLSKTDTVYYSQLLEGLYNGYTDDFKELKEFKHAFLTIRKNFRLISKESGADIEPSIQTELLDNCIQIKGVLAGVVPGAGGFDAISLIASENTDIESETSGLTAFSNVSWMKLKQAECGLMEEDPQHYIGLRAAH